MNWREYLRHLWNWLQQFPRWAETEHACLRPVDGTHYECLICGRVYEESY